MFTIWNPFGIQEPYWGKVGKIEAIQATGKDQKELWHLKPKELKTNKKVHNYRFVLDQESEEEEEKKPPILALQIMSFPVITLHPDQTIEEAEKLFAKTNLHYILIALENQTLVGILSDRTLFRKRPSLKPSTLIKDVMTTQIIASSPTTPIRKIAQLFIIEKIGCMPIVEENVIVGMITKSDILRTIIHLI